MSNQTNKNSEENFLQPLVRPDIKPEVFDVAIRQKGYRVIWEQNMFCSCYPDRTSDQPDMNCPYCRGKGYVYFDQKEIRVLVTSINGHKEQERIGLMDFGTAYLTPGSQDDVGFRDRFTFLDFTSKYSEIIYKDNDRGFPGDTLNYPCKNMISLRSGNTVYKNGIDFIVSDDGLRVEWLGKEEPAYGSLYSVLYHISPVYIAINPIHELRGTYTMLNGKGLENFVTLPKQFQIKREDFI